MKARSLTLGLIVFVLVIGVVYWIFGFSSNPHYQYETVTLSKMVQTPNIRIAASVVEDSLYPLYAKEDGIVTEIFVQVGSKVKKGDILASLDLNAVDLAYAKKVKNLQINFVNKNSVDEYFRKISDLEKKGFYNSAEAVGIKLQMANNIRDVLSLQEAITRLENRTEGKLIRAPFDGIVADINWQLGDKVVASRQLVAGFSVNSTIARYKAKLEIPEDVASQIFPGTSIELALPLNRSSVLGKVMSISSSLYEDNKNRYLPGVAKLAVNAQQAKSLKNGMRLLGTISATMEQPGVWIPRAAIDLKLPENMIFETISYLKKDRNILSRKLASEGGATNGDVSDLAKNMSPAIQTGQNTLSPNESSVREVYLLTGSRKIIKAIIEDGPGDDRYTLVDVPELEGSQIIVGVEPVSKLKELFSVR